MEFKKGTWMIISKDGEFTNMSMDLDKDRELKNGDIFEWQPNPTWKPLKIKVVHASFPLIIEDVEE